jgi:hypothetical protein
MDYLLFLLALVGHTSLWVAAINRVHGVDLPYRVARRISRVMMLLLGIIALGLGTWVLTAGLTILDASGRMDPKIPGPVRAYLVVCWIAAAVASIVWLARKLRDRPPGIQRCHRRERVALRSPTKGGNWETNGHHFLLRLPGNESFDLDLAERALEIAWLPAELDGLSIVHLSDLHFTGLVHKAYFEEVVRRSNQFEPDLVAVTGDLLDHSDYTDWIPDTLGRLKSRYGVYFVLGNHDSKIDFLRLRRALGDSGLIDLGSRWVEIRVGAHAIVLAGNELPWFTPAADLAGAPAKTSGGPLRIALSHSPDQLAWARAHEVDLLLAGHTHGGQIRFPLIGPILTPSLAGVKYACGVFHRPPTVMHVSRGVSGEHPIRWNCPPEITRLVLHCPGHSQCPGK